MQYYPPNQYPQEQPYLQQQPYPYPQQSSQSSYPDLPTQRVPVTPRPVHLLKKPAKQSSPKWVMGWTGAIIAILVLAIASFVIAAINSRNSQSGSATPTAQPTAKLTTKLPAVTYGTPRLGGPVSDFVGKYRQPSSQASGTETFWTDSAQTISVSAGYNAQEIVTRVSVLGPDSWSSTQTESACEAFLPGDAQQLNNPPEEPPTYIDYRSSLGEIVMEIILPSCLVFVDQS